MAFRIKGNDTIRYHLDGEWHKGVVKEVDITCGYYRIILNPGDKRGHRLRWFPRKQLRIVHRRKKARHVKSKGS